MSKCGKLFGIGVGPGDPELLTLKAVRMINEADVVFTAASAKRNYSLALEIARPHMSETAVIKYLSFIMTKDKKATEKAWDENASRIAAVLRDGKSAAFLTLGDPTTYSTFGYILKSLKKVMPDAEVETVPGITSFHAAAARLNRTLVEGEQSLLITSGAYGGDQLQRVGENVESIVMMKAYKNVKQNNAALKAAGFFEKSVAISKCGREGEEIIPDLNELEKRVPNYWTLVLAAK
ncbi:CbiL [Desulfamplus magnetovallimortis]|uniref:CbiL n=1 Tax=Desulfamplus magnetovallimortis TaxID=1246637 RepID=A0A1W1HCT0_9BACT|nr:precorrin-2 C(20)-methyltransferase [Desulfamplus magnetovallimortis]SLM30246.1 CbiL [Desulfamplus magnetovallimortis]